MGRAMFFTGKMIGHMDLALARWKTALCPAWRWRVPFPSGWHWPLGQTSNLRRRGGKKIVQLRCQDEAPAGDADKSEYYKNIGCRLVTLLDADRRSEDLTIVELS